MEDEDLESINVFKQHPWLKKRFTDCRYEFAFPNSPKTSIMRTRPHASPYWPPTSPSLLQRSASDDGSETDTVRPRLSEDDELQLAMNIFDQVDDAVPCTPLKAFYIQISDLEQAELWAFSHPIALPSWPNRRFLSKHRAKLKGVSQHRQRTKYDYLTNVVLERYFGITRLPVHNFCQVAERQSEQSQDILQRVKSRPRDAPRMNNTVPLMTLGSGIQRDRSNQAAELQRGRKQEDVQTGRRNSAAIQIRFADDALQLVDKASSSLATLEKGFALASFTPHPKTLMTAKAKLRIFEMRQPSKDIVGVELMIQHTKRPEMFSRCSFDTSTKGTAQFPSS
jgi:hypothetical protein